MTSTNLCSPIKAGFFEDIAAEIFVQQNVRTTTTKIMKTLFLRNDHTQFLTCFNFNSKFPLFAKKSYIFNNSKIN